MKLQRFEVSNTPQLTLVCHGDLDINGGRKGELAIKGYGGEGDLQVQREGEHFTITSHSRCKIGCPRGTNVTVKAVHGDLRLRGLDGPLAIDLVSGDAVLKELGPTTVNHTHGDLRARAISGALQVEQVGGDVSVRGVEGLLRCGQVGGDFSGAYLEGGLDATVGGDSSLKVDFTSGSSYRLQTGGDAACKFPTNANARFQVTAGGDIGHNVDWTEVQQSPRTLNGRVGEGEAQVEIKAGGDVSLKSRSDSGAFVFSFELEEEGMELELESMAEEIERNIEEQMSRLNDELSARLSHIDHEAIRRRAEQAAEKVRRKAEQTAERARMQAERAQRRWERMGTQRWARTAPGEAPREKQAEPVSDQERLAILRMVQEGKITADDAARLLEALEG